MAEPVAAVCPYTGERTAEQGELPAAVTGDRAEALTLRCVDRQLLLDGRAKVDVKQHGPRTPVDNRDETEPPGGLDDGDRVDRADAEGFGERREELSAVGDAHHLDGVGTALPADELVAVGEVGG